MTDKRIDSVFYIGVPIQEDLHEALIEVMRERTSISDEDRLLLSDLKHAPGTNPMLPVARSIYREGHDLFKKIPQSSIYLGMCGDKKSPRFFLACEVGYMPSRYEMMATNLMKTAIKRIAEHEATVKVGLEQFGVPSTEVDRFGIYISAVEW